MLKTTKTHIPENSSDASWTLFDIVGVLLSVFCISIAVLIAVYFLVSDRNLVLDILKFVMSASMLFLPLIWVSKRYNLSIKSLGLRKGPFSWAKIFLFGVIAFLGLIPLIFFVPESQGLTSLDYTTSKLVFYLIIYPISIGGFAIIVLAPIGEEVLFRGFIYSFLRRKTGIIPGLILQALLFSVIHLDFFLETRHIYSYHVLL